MTEWLHFHFSLSCIGEGNGNLLQCSCLENPRDRGAWWAAIYGVSQSLTRLKQLNSSSTSSHVESQSTTVNRRSRVPVSTHRKVIITVWAFFFFFFLSLPRDHGWSRAPLIIFTSMLLTSCAATRICNRSLLPAISLQYHLQWKWHVHILKVKFWKEFQPWLQSRY